MRKLARPLRLQPFRRLLAAYAINAIGGWAGEIALAVLVLERTGSAAGVGAVLLAGQLLPALPAPWLTDRAGRLPAGRGLVLLLWLQGGIFAALALSASSRFSLPATLAMIALDGAAAIAARALLKAAACAVTAPAGLLREGNALLTNVFTMSVAGGPLLGGALVATAGPVAGLAVDAASFALAALVLGGRTPSAHTAAERARGGLALLAGRRPLRLLVAGNAAVTVFGAAIVPVEVVFVTETLGGGPGAYGAVLTAWGVGMLAGGACTAVLRAAPLLALLAGSVALTAVSYLGMGCATTLGTLYACSLAGGVANGVEAFALLTAIQERAGERHQAQIGGCLEAITAACTGVGFVTGAAVATLVSARAAYIVAGGGILLALAVVGPVLRREAGDRSRRRRRSASVSRHERLAARPAPGDAR